MKKLLVLLTVCFCSSMSRADINVSYGVSCSTLTNTATNGEVINRTFIPSNLFAGVKVGTKHTIGLKVETAIADMYSFDLKELNFHFNPDKVQYTLEINHNF